MATLVQNKIGNLVFVRANSTGNVARCDRKNGNNRKFDNNSEAEGIDCDGKNDDDGDDDKDDGDDNDGDNDNCNSDKDNDNSVDDFDENNGGSSLVVHGLLGL